MPIQATINGKRVELSQPMSLAQYLEDKGLSGRRIAAAHNGNVVSREEYDSVTIHDGDTLEIVRPVGGG